MRHLGDHAHRVRRSPRRSARRRWMARLARRPWPISRRLRVPTRPVSPVDVRREVVVVHEAVVTTRPQSVRTSCWSRTVPSVVTIERSVSPRVKSAGAVRARRKLDSAEIGRTDACKSTAIGPAVRLRGSRCRRYLRFDDLLERPLADVTAASARSVGRQGLGWRSLGGDRLQTPPGGAAWSGVSTARARRIRRASSPAHQVPDPRRGPPSPEIALGARPPAGGVQLDRPPEPLLAGRQRAGQPPHQRPRAAPGAVDFDLSTMALGPGDDDGSRCDASSSVTSKPG